MNFKEKINYLGRKINWFFLYINATKPPYSQRFFEMTNKDSQLVTKLSKEVFNRRKNFVSNYTIPQNYPIQNNSN